METLRGWGRRFRLPALWIALGLVLLIRVPFLNQAIQGDDHTYLVEAAHALVEPLHPMHVKDVFLGNQVDLRGHSHPPLNAWVLAGLIAVFGEVREVPFHAFYIVFSLLAVWAMWSLARRFSPHPLWATLLLIAVPAFVVNGTSLETDLPFLAFWLASVALFCSGRLALACIAMALAALTSYQAIFLTPVLAAYLWINHRRGRAPWLALLVPPLAIAGFQLFERLTTGAAPAAVLTGYFESYGFQNISAKLANAAMLAIHSWFIVFPALIPPAFILAWRKRRDPDTRFLLAWIAIFFACAVAVFFAGSARYLLPMAAPVALLASRLRPRWLAAGFALQLSLGLGLAAANYQHWDGYRRFADSIRPATAGHRVWIDGEWGLRYYLETQGGLALQKTTQVRPGDFIVSSELGHSVDVTAPLATVASAVIQPSVPFRILGLESHSGYSTVSRGFWPFGISAGVVDRLRAAQVVERHPTLEYLPMNAPEAAGQIVSGIFALEGPIRWSSRTAIVALKSPAEPLPLSVSFTIHPASAARRVKLLLDGREVASQTYTGPGTYTLATAPIQPAGPVSVVTIEVDRTFTAPPDMRELGIVLSAVGFTAIPRP
jgi:Dolichyl-phosphate-mannose-protein mannosyltransferase